MKKHIWLARRYRVFDKTLTCVKTVLGGVSAIIMRGRANVNMDIFEQLRSIDQTVKDRHRELCINDKNLYALDYGEGHILGGGVSFAGQQVPWAMSQQFPQISLHQDFDHDGIPDALDNYNGPGAQAPHFW